MSPRLENMEVQIHRVANEDDPETKLRTGLTKPADLIPNLPCRLSPPSLRVDFISLNLTGSVGHHLLAIGQSSLAQPRLLFLFWDGGTGRHPRRQTCLVDTMGITAQAPEKCGTIKDFPMPFDFRDFLYPKKPFESLFP